MDNLMKRAVELAIKNVKDGGQPFGAVLAKNNQIVAEGVNALHKTYDVSGHAELQAIRHAQKQLQTNSLSGYTMYASGEPCPMCLSAMYFAGIDKIYYCVSVEDAASVGLTKSQMIYKDLQKPKKERTLPMVQMPLEENQIDPLEAWSASNNKDK